MTFRIFFVAIISLSLSYQAQALEWGIRSSKRDYIYLVGSSTISPLMAAVSEEFSRSKAVVNAAIQTPIVESTGTVAGFQSFCSGVGHKYPDFVNASRAIDKKELKYCYKNGARDLMKIKIGYDGIVIANSKGKRRLSLTKNQIFLALAEKIYDKKTNKLVDNPYKNWNEIDPKLPKSAIVFYGPPVTSGTRDVFTDLIMEESCLTQQDFINLFESRSKLKEQCHKIRNDGVFIASGENDDNIIRSLKHHPAALGIFGFNFLIANSAKIQPVAIDNIKPSYESISSKKYQLSRPLFVYFKVESLDLLPEMKDFIKEIISTETIGKKGYLVHSGLVPLSNLEVKELRKDVLRKLN